MNNNKILILFALIVLVGVFSFKFLPREESISRSESGLRIGAGDDVTGIILDEIIGLYNPSNKAVIPSENKFFMEDYSFKDC